MRTTQWAAMANLMQALNELEQALARDERGAAFNLLARAKKLAQPEADAPAESGQDGGRPTAEPRTPSDTPAAERSTWTNEREEEFNGEVHDLLDAAADAIDGPGPEQCVAKTLEVVERLREKLITEQGGQTATDDEDELSVDDHLIADAWDTIDNAASMQEFMAEAELPIDSQLTQKQAHGRWLIQTTIAQLMRCGLQQLEREGREQHAKHRAECADLARQLARALERLEQKSAEAP